MKEIGQRLQEAREGIGVSLEEAAEDLKLKPSQLQNIESGNMEAFKDIFYLKYFIRDYAKYLGLDFEDIVDEFNEYLFDYTSKISVDDIKKAKTKMSNVKEPKKMMSPYTMEQPKHKEIPLYVYIIVIVILILSVLFVYFITNKDKDKTQVVVRLERETYEFA